MPAPSGILRRAPDAEKPGSITYLIGDATEPVGAGRKIIAHICNDRGIWGGGFTGALSKK